jgi:hypothetical protein
MASLKPRAQPEVVVVVFLLFVVVVVELVAPISVFQSTFPSESSLAMNASGVAHIASLGHHINVAGVIDFHIIAPVIIQATEAFGPHDIATGIELDNKCDFSAGAREGRGTDGGGSRKRPNGIDAAVGAGGDFGAKVSINDFQPNGPK